MKILVDMNLSPGWVNFLVEAGFDAVHWSQVGSSNAPDSELMQWAAERNCIVLTADLDFGAILAATQLTRPSVIQVRSGLLTPLAIGGMVVSAIRKPARNCLMVPLCPSTRSGRGFAFFPSMIRRIKSL
jgi:predicted nuclease of predicted toxin-antitoxin system